MKFDKKPKAKPCVRCWFIGHDAGDLIHVTTEGETFEDMVKLFPKRDGYVDGFGNSTIKALTPAVTKNTFRIRISIDTIIEVR